MFEPANLDPREQEIFDQADEWWATRFQGRGVYDKIGPFPTQLDAVKGCAAFFRMEEKDYPPPDSIWSRPFALYAASTRHGGSHVVVGCVYRDGVRRPTYKEVTQKRQEERKLARNHTSNRGNSSRGDPV